MVLFVFSLILASLLCFMIDYVRICGLLQYFMINFVSICGLLQCFTDDVQDLHQN